MSTITSKITTVVVGFAMVVALAFTFSVPAVHAALTESQIQSILSLLSSFGADQTTINNVNASLRGQATSGGSTSSGASCSAFSRDLTLNATGSDVQALQVLLNANGFPVAATGAGSAGSESTFFGSLTQSALAKWQAANGVSPAVGYFGPITRAALASSGACGATSGGTTGGTTTPAPVGTGLSVSAATQPQNGLAPQGTSRVPFTNFTLTAGSDGAVTVNSVVVKRTGLGNNAAFAGVVLIDQDGNQLGTAKSFNSNDQATIGEAFTIPAGQSRTFTVGGNMAASLATRAGEVPAISVIAINTSAAVSGSLPITGAFHTLNATLAVGTITVSQSNAFATNANTTKEIGTSAWRSTGIRLTAGSAEDIMLKTLRFNQSGSASTVNDLANIQAVVRGTAYPTTVSADGKFVTANLGSGVLLAEGDNVEVYIQYDIVGSNSNGRTIIFDIDDVTDIYGVGQTFGFGVTPVIPTSVTVPSTRGTFTITSGTPYVFDTQVTVEGASVTTIAKANSVPAQNIAVNVPEQPLGGFVVDIKGEPITVQSMVFTVATSGGSGTGLLTNVSIVNENGAVIAGPVDATGAGTSLTFTDSVTFPSGAHNYSIRGKVASAIGNNTIYTLSSNPSTGWTNVKGELTGDTITISQGSFSMNAMTVKSGQLAVSNGTQPASQTIVGGGTDVLFANFQFDATESGEDLRFSQIPTTLTFGGTSVKTDLSSCRLFDGGTSLMSGSNVINPGDATATTSAFTKTATLDNSVTVAKGTLKTLSLRCNVSGNATSGGTYQFAVTAVTSSNFTITGATSGNAITGTGGGTSGAPTFTIGSSSVTVTTGAGTPGYAVAASGSTGVIGGVLQFRATNEAFNLQKLGLQLTNTASSSSGDLIKASIYDGTVKVGEAFFTGGNTTATSTFTQIVQLPKDLDKSLTVKLDFANVGVNQSVAFSGHLVAVDYLNAEGVGAESGTTSKLSTAAGSTAVSGVRVFKSFPTLALDTLTSIGVADGKLLRFKVTADSAGPVSVTQFAVNLATTTASVTNVTIYGFTDAGYSLPISGVAADGNLQQTNDCVSGCPSTGDAVVGVANSSGATTIQIPAGGTRYFEVRGSVSGATSGASVTTKVYGSSAFPSTAAGVGANPLLATGSTGVDTGTNAFVWSPNSTTTPNRNSQDWTNGFGLSGLPSGGLIQTRSQ